jgi:DedD protein
VQDVEIRIPGQDEKPFAPKFAVAPVEKAAPGVAEPAPESKAPAEAAKPAARPGEPAREEPAEKAVDTKTEKAPEKPAEKPAEKAAAKPEKPAAKDSADARRAAAILAGQGSAPEAAPAKAGEFVILIGAFANEENVRNLRAKLAEKNIRTYVEPLDTPGGRKTRVRAGPFPSREAADKALEKMKQVGISGVVAGK